MNTAKEKYIEQLCSHLRNYEQQDLRSVRQLAKDCGWDCTEQELLQAAELCVVLVCREIAHNSQKSLREQFDEIVEIYNAQPVISPKDSLSKQLQQYSTPAPLAFLAGRYILSNEPKARYIEPSAGNGLLTIALPKEQTTVNEIDPIRFENLKYQGFSMMYQDDASDVRQMGMARQAYTGVITNPPFAQLKPSEYLTRSGVVGGKTMIYDFQELDHKMAILALETMHRYGKAAVIIGGKLHEEYHKNGRLFGRLKHFITYLNRQYNLEDVVYINGDHIYQRQGTTFPIILLLINGRREWASEKSHQWHAYDPALDTPIQTFDELFDRIAPRLTGVTTQHEQQVSTHQSKHDKLSDEDAEKWVTLEADILKLTRTKEAVNHRITFIQQRKEYLIANNEYNENEYKELLILRKNTNEKIKNFQQQIAKMGITDEKKYYKISSAYMNRPFELSEEWTSKSDKEILEELMVSTDTTERETRLRLAKAKIKIAKAKIAIAEQEAAQEHTRKKLNDMGEKIGGSAKDRYVKGQKSGEKVSIEKPVYLAMKIKDYLDRFNLKKGYYVDIYASHYKAHNKKGLWDATQGWVTSKRPYVLVVENYLIEGYKMFFQYKSDYREVFAQYMEDEQYNQVMEEYDDFIYAARVLLAQLDEQEKEKPKQPKQPKEKKEKNVYLHSRVYTNRSTWVVFATYTPTFTNGTYNKGNYVTVLSEDDIKELFGENRWRNKNDWRDNSSTSHLLKQYISDHEQELKDKARTLLEHKFGEGFINKAGLIAKERKGKDWRKGKDATEDDFLEVFGFRAVEFGETMPQKERKEHFNRTYDAFMDLADICGFSPAAISLGGTLGICFGSRGKGGRGAASAHYEPTKKVINLTRLTGAGGLAHEWFHALDHSLSTNREAATDRLGDYTDNSQYVVVVLQGNKTYKEAEQRFVQWLLDNCDMLTHHFDNDNDYTHWWKDDCICMRHQTAFALQAIVTTCKQSNIYKDSQKLDKRGTHRKNGTRAGYWTQPTEMGARSFEYYVIHKLADKGYINEYLAQIPEYKVDGSVYPYPRPANDDPDSYESRESRYIMRAYDLLFSTLQEVEGDIKNKKLNGVK